MKLKEELRKEVSCLRIELQQVRDDRDHLSTQAQSLTFEVENYRELTKKSTKDLDYITLKIIALEVCFHMKLHPHVFCYSYSNVIYLFFITYRRHAHPKEKKYNS